MPIQTTNNILRIRCGMSRHNNLLFGGWFHQFKISFDLKNTWCTLLCIYRKLRYILLFVCTIFHTLPNCQRFVKYFDLVEVFPANTSIKNSYITDTIKNTFMYVSLLLSGTYWSRTAATSGRLSLSKLSITFRKSKEYSTGDVCNIHSF